MIIRMDILWVINRDGFFPVGLYQPYWLCVLIMALVINQENFYWLKPIGAGAF
jgi:hypothetical protein